MTPADDDIPRHRIVQIDDLYIRCSVYEAVIAMLIEEAGIDTSRLKARIEQNEFGSHKSRRPYADQVEELDAVLVRIGAGPQLG